MIVLDTNVVSALMLREPDRVAIEWLDHQPSASVWTTSVTVFEVRFGLDLLPSGRRRRALEEAFEHALAEDFEGRVLTFDQAAASTAGAIAARCRRSGRPVEIRDAQIAGIVAAHRATLATRNTRHFLDMGLRLVDPWSTTST